jgi:alanine dehydrogenase
MPTSPCPSGSRQGALEAEVVVGAVFVAATPTPRLLPRSARAAHAARQRDRRHLDRRRGRGGDLARDHPHDPSFVEEGVIHYCVPNIPAAAPAEATAALSAAVLPYVRAIAALGLEQALLADPGLRAGVLLWRGRVNHPGIAAEAALPYTALADDDLR